MSNIALLRQTIVFAFAFAMGIFFALFLHPTKAPAGAYEQVVCDQEPDPVLCLTINNWFWSAKTNDGGSCCGLGDAYWTDDTQQVTEDGIYVTVTDPRSCKGPAPEYNEESGAPQVDTEKEAGCIRKPDLNGKVLWIPKERIDRRGQGNPTGHAITFVNTGIGSRSIIYDPAGKEFPAIYCFFPGAGI